LLGRICLNQDVTELRRHDQNAYQAEIDDTRRCRSGAASGSVQRRWMNWSADFIAALLIRRQLIGMVAPESGGATERT
jgi:hypothetical protein